MTQKAVRERTEFRERRGGGVRGELKDRRSGQDLGQAFR